MSAISWAGLETFSSPASTSTASSGDDFFRSFMSSVATGLATSFVWPGSGGGSLASAGVSVPGNARCARAGNSAVTGGYGDGFLLLNQNHISLHHIGSTWTGLLGHSAMVDHGGGLGTAPFTGRWLTQSGVWVPGGDSSSQTTAFTFAAAYAVKPFMQFGQSESSNGYAVNIISLTTVGFTAAFSSLRGSNSAGTINWESNGTVLN